MDGKQFSLITIGMIILLGIVGLGFMQMNTNNAVSTIANRLVAVEKQVNQEPVKTTPTTTTDTDAPCPGDCDAGITEIAGYTADFTIHHPEGFYTAMVENAFIDGQRDLRITSKPGTLYLPGASASQKSTEFTNGIQFEIRKLADGQLHFSGDEKFRDTGNPLVKELVTMCNHTGCLDRVFYINANKNTYVMDVIASPGYVHMERDLKTVIDSIKIEN